MTVEEQDLKEQGSMLTFFGSEVQRLRQRKGVSQDALAKATHCARTLVNKIENAVRVPSKDFAKGADEFLDADGHLTRLWPLVILYAYPSWFRPLVELEKQAAVIRTFEPTLVPGLLQTRDYARATLTVRRTNDVDTLLDARMERQTILERESPPELWAVMDETLLRRRVGDARVMREQLQRLMDLSERPSIVIQVVPSSIGAHAAVAGAFHTLTFKEGVKGTRALPVVHADGFLRGQLSADPADFKAAQRAYDLLMGEALSVQASIDLIADVMKETT
ncbi:helix-turn-helix transcriptional regulator [Streptomyces sp. NBC_00078]|uniref:helix-turn-helix domain-containing protein n=1 Tax=unclassified Streptomyces TaxID=2593676 RepID=UPI002252D2E9|nr:helix-turn-helix transcriptional regulator [Streptomyces sp. NBC_00078]MCX5423163.1 helix-turn-helix domain-containing protein [Streptomyces sp. NBC_00078]